MPTSRETSVSFDDAVRMAAETISKELTGMPDGASAADSATQEMDSGDNGLDAVPRRMQNLRQRPVVAVLNFSSASEELSARAITELEAALRRNGLDVSARGELPLILGEQRFQLSGAISDDTAVAIGKGTGAQFVITGELSDEVDYYFFHIKAINVQTALYGSTASHKIARDDRRIRHLMRSAKTKAEADRRAAEAKAEAERRATVAKENDERRAAEAKQRAVATRAFKQYSEDAYRSPIEYGVNHYIEWNNNYTGLYAEPIAVHWSFLPFTSVGLGANFGFGKTHDGQKLFKAGVTPYAGLVVPVNETIRFFGDGLMEVGYNDMGGFLDIPGIAMNPGFDAGMQFSFNNGMSFNLRYKGLWAGDGNYVHSFGITLAEDVGKGNGFWGDGYFGNILGFIGSVLVGFAVPGAIYWVPRSLGSDNGTNADLGGTMASLLALPIGLGMVLPPLIAGIEEQKEARSRLRSVRQ